MGEEKKKVRFNYARLSRTVKYDRPNEWSWVLKFLKSHVAGAVKFDSPSEHPSILKFGILAC